MPSFKYQVSLCAMYKNEAKYLAEWIEYHRMIGVDHFYLYNNNSTDQHFSLIKPYINLGLISYHEYNVDITHVGSMNTFKDPNYPYNSCINDYKLESEYIGFIDIDEFIVVRSGQSLSKLMKNYKNYAGLAINWLTFGSTNHYLDPDQLVTESYFMRPPINHPYNQLVKSIINPRLFLGWPNVHLPLMNGVIVREDESVCTHFNDKNIMHKLISLFHYRGKSKEFYLFGKIQRHIDLSQLKTPVINAHRKGGDSFFEIYYSNVLMWEASNMIDCNCIEDLTIFKQLPSLKKRLGLKTSTVSQPTLLDYQLIDYEDYISKTPALKTYINENRVMFNHSLLPMVYHYWFIFDEKKTDRVKLGPARSLLKKVDLDHYRTETFRNFIESQVNSSEKIVVTDNLIYKYHMDFVLGLPRSFDWSYYISQSSTLSDLNEYGAINHWYSNGLSRGSFCGRRLGGEKIRLLILDCLFPVLFGQWRTVEINYLLSHPDFDVDILINPYSHLVNEFAGENMIISFERYYQLYPHLNDYNIMIFNPEFNVINRFNKKIDGTVFNKTVNAQFLLTKNRDFDFRAYDLAYSIFFGVRNENSFLVNQKWWPSVCKIYPGGGYLYNEQINSKLLKEMDLNNETAIVTQEFIAQTCSKYLKNVKKIYGVPIISPEMTFKEKVFSDNKLEVCFSSLGYNPKKGFENYISIARRFLEKHPDLKIKFHVVGIPGTNPKAVNLSNITYHRIMPPNQLSSFYSNQIDVIVSPIVAVVEGGDPDGFPLGSEAMIHGCIPVLCDPHGGNQQFGFNETDSLVMVRFNLDRTEQFLLSLYNDLKLRHSMSQAIAKKSQVVFSPEKQLNPVVDVLMTTVAKTRTERLLADIPTDFIGGCDLTKAKLITELIIENKLLKCVDIGVWRGRSFAPMVIACELIGGHAYGVDPYTAECMDESDLPTDIVTELRRVIPTLNFEKIYQNVNDLLCKNFSHFSLIRKSAKDAICSGEIPAVIDLVHIDGNHDRDLVTLDVDYYLPRVRPNGYIIMDDLYFDTVKSVLPKLDHFAEKIADYGTWGLWKKKTPPPFSLNSLLMTNPILNDPEVKFCVVIATYYRQNGSTDGFLKRCLKSIANQKYTNWVIYLVGDEYEPESELYGMSELIENGKLIIHNKGGSERTHIKDKTKLWYVGGASAMNYGLNLVRKNQFKYYVHLDDDDYWEPFHLLSMAHVFKTYPYCAFAYTQSSYNRYPGQLPETHIQSIYENNLIPRRERLIHSSVCFRADVIPFDYFTTQDEKQIVDASDARMWDQIVTFLKGSRYYAIYIPLKTCHHDIEGSVINSGK
jgi:hypothetical protein